MSDLKGPLADNISHLTKSWRFDASKALGKIAEASREGEELIVTTLLSKTATTIRESTTR